MKQTTKKPKISYEITACYGGKFNTGNYEQESDLYSVKKVIEGNGELSTDDILNHQRELQAIVYAMFIEDKNRLRGVPVSNVVDDVKTVAIQDNQPVKLQETDYQTINKMTWITLISQAPTIEKLKSYGTEIAKQKNKFTADVLEEIRSEFNAKMNELTKE